MCKVQRLSERSTAKWLEAVRTQMSDDIVYSAWGHVAVHKRTGREVTSSIEYKVTYGMGRETFKHYAYDMYGIKFTDDEAKELIGKFFKAYPGLKKYHTMVGNKMKSSYIGTTALGYRMKPQGYAEGINGPTQGTGGEAMRLAIHLLVKKDKRALKYIVNSIHDAAYLIVPIEDKDYWSKSLEDAMQESWYEIRKSNMFYFHNIPMPVEIMSGFHMGELEEDFAGGGQALTMAEMREAKERNKQLGRGEGNEKN